MATRTGTMEPEKVEAAKEPPAPEEEQPESERAEASEEESPPEEVDYDSRKMDPDLEVWDGGPTFGQINAWKDEFGEIYVTSITPEKHVVWRTMTRFEYRRLIKSLEQALSTGQVSQAEANLNNEEAIAKLCILYPPYNPETTAAELAGVASTISNQVMEASAFTSVEVRQL